MNREKVKKLLPILQAFSEGKKIQYKDLNTGEWLDVREKDWFNSSFIGEYRVAPKVVSVTSYVVFSTPNDQVLYQCSTERGARNWKNMYYNDSLYPHVVVIKLEGSYER